MDSFDISASALTAQRLRLDVISSNLANINTTRNADGTLGAYRRRNVVFAPILNNQMASGGKQNGSMSVHFENGVPTLKAGVSNNMISPGNGVQVVEINQDMKTPLRTVYDPTNPDADTNGYVQMPNINPVSEMVDMISATRAYEANVTALQASKSMLKSAMDI